MKNFILFVALVLPALASAQSDFSFKDVEGGGVIIGYHTSNSWSFGVGGQFRRHIFSAEYLIQNNDKLGKTKGKQLSNYGRTVIADGEYLQGGIVSYGYSINQDWAVIADAALAARIFYLNYSDRRFKEGGYNMVAHKEFAAGPGLSVRYHVYKAIFASAGFNTLTGFRFSVLVSNVNL